MELDHSRIRSARLKQPKLYHAHLANAREYKQRMPTMPKFTEMDAKATNFKLVIQ